MSRPHVVVVGGGLAGLSAALQAADRGMRVSLFEARPRLGGATWSFERRGHSFDNGQHVYLACCSAYRRFLERINMTLFAPLHRLDIPVLRPTREGVKTARIKRGDAVAPLHLARSLLSYGHLSRTDRGKIGLAALALHRCDLKDRSLDEETLESFLLRHHQSPRSIEVLWDLIALPTINVHAREASLLVAAKVFKTGLLSDNAAADIGWATVPLTSLHVAPALEALAASGARVVSTAKVSSIDLDSSASSATGVVVDGEHVDADAVVIATNPEALSELAPPAAKIDLCGIFRLGGSPIIDVHLVYDQKVLDLPIAAAIDSPVQYVFDRTLAAGLSPGEGQCVAISISGADEVHGEPVKVLIDRYRHGFETLFPRARQARLLDAVVSREHRATFRAIPGTDRFRPRTETAIGNLVLAGAYTSTGWPATMEGAVLSGERAIERLDAALCSTASPATYKEAI